MPRTLIQAPGHDRHRSLGWLAVAWVEHFCVHGPGGVQGKPVRFHDEYTQFIVDCYALGDEPSNAHMLYDSTFLSRPKGCWKSGVGALLALFEALGPCRFGGWAKGGERYTDPWGLGFTYTYEPGEPMGRHVTAPMIRCLATEETQVGHVFATIHYNLTDEDTLLFRVPGVQAGVDKILLPWGGDIRVSTASASAKDGGKETFVVFDESHLYNTPELRRMYDTVTRNLVKRKNAFDGTWYIETTTMFAPGEESVAELTFLEAEALAEGRKKRGDHRLLYDHRWGEVKDEADEEALKVALAEAYGDCMEWMDLRALVNEFYNTRKKSADNRRYFLNAQTSSVGAWIQVEEWAACGKPEKPSLKPKDMVTLGFDGSVRDDSTALVACRVSDSHIQMLGLWEKPDGTAGEGWQVDRESVDAAVADAMKTYEVVGFYADPAHWQDYLDRWHNEYAHKMQVKVSEKKPLEFWANRSTVMVAALQRFYEAVGEERISYTPPEDRVGAESDLSKALTRQVLDAADPIARFSALTRALTRHVLNARVHLGNRAGLLIRKDTPHSAKKIDGCMAAVLAYEAACDAIAKGTKPNRLKRYAARRIR